MAKTLGYGCKLPDDIEVEPASDQPLCKLSVWLLTCRQKFSSFRVRVKNACACYKHYRLQTRHRLPLRREKAITALNH